tara:strand:+ start:777 stop:911 length:135 start_codon:yes stop_codon:yes gene_type:complete
MICSIRSEEQPDELALKRFYSIPLDTLRKIKLPKIIEEKRKAAV